MTITAEDLRNEEVIGFIRGLFRTDFFNKDEEFTEHIRNVIRRELFNLSDEIPKYSFEALILQQILDKIKEHDKMFCDLKSEISGVKTEMSDMKTEISGMKTEMSDMKTEISGMKTEMSDMKTEMSDMKTEISDMKTEMSDMKTEMSDMKTEMSGVKNEVSDLSKKIDDLKSWVGSVVGGFQNRAGKNLEKMVAGTLRLAFKRRDIEASSIRMRQKFADTDGIIGLKGRNYEIDILADGDAMLVFEIKSLCDLEMAERFADKVTLIKHIHPNKNVSGALISLESDPEVIGYCKTHDIALVS